MERFEYHIPGVSTGLTREGTMERILRYITVELMYSRSENEVLPYRVRVDMDKLRPPFHCRLSFYPGNKNLALRLVDWEGAMTPNDTAVALLGAIESLLKQHAEDLASGK